MQQTNALQIFLRKFYGTLRQRPLLNCNYEKLKTKGAFFACYLLFKCLGIHAQCASSNSAFKSGEQLSYSVVYNWGMVWLESAHVSFSVKAATAGNKPAYVFKGSGGTFPKYDWFFKVRDEFETTVDSASMRPLKFKADIAEGNKNDHHTYIFDLAKERAYTIITRGKKKTMVDTISFKPCNVDVLSAIYYARNIDYSKYAVNDTISISVLLDGTVFPLYIRYLGKEVFNSPLFGKYNCIKFKPLLVEGSIFNAGEHMTVFVTDDKNKVPLYVETEIIVGKVKVSLSSMSGLKYPLDSKIEN